MPDKIVEQLQALRTESAGGEPDARWLASTKETLLMQIRNTVGETRPAGFRALAENFRLFLPAQFRNTMTAALAAVILMFGAGASASIAVAAAQKTLPGDRLYSVKLAAEKVSLRFSGKNERTDRRLNVAGRRLDEMARLAASTDAHKEEKLLKASALFSSEMALVEKALVDLQADADAETAIGVALRVDAKVDEYQMIFRQGLLVGRPMFRLALLGLDQVSVKALEILIEKQSVALNALPEAQLTSAVGKKIEAFATHVAATEGSLTAKGPTAASSLAAKAKVAVEEAKILLSQGNFQAAVRKVRESADLVSEAESADKADSSETASASGTEEAAQAASSTEEAGTPSQ